MKKIIYSLFVMMLLDEVVATPDGVETSSQENVFQNSEQPKISMSEEELMAKDAIPEDKEAFSKLEKLSEKLHGSEFNFLCDRVEESLKKSHHIQQNLINEIDALYQREYPDKTAKSK